MKVHAETTTVIVLTLTPREAHLVGAVLWQEGAGEIEALGDELKEAAADAGYHA